jgi:hypothetical protein
MVRRKVSSCILFLVLCTTAVAQDGYKGKEFWMVFPRNARAGENPTPLEECIHIVGKEGTKGIIKHTASGKEQPYTIGPNQYVKVNLDTAQNIFFGKHSNTWFVSSSDEVSIIAVSHRQASTDSYMVLPVNRLGKEYAVVGYSPMIGADMFNTQFDIIATEDNTLITIEYPKAKKRTSDTERLDRGQGLHYDSKVTSKLQDLTGTIITSDKPIAFLTGHVCAQIPADVTFCDILLEMLPPTSELGREYIITKLAERERSTIRVVAIADNTEVFLNGEWKTVLGRGDFYQSDSITRSAQVTTSQSAYVMQYGQSMDVSESKIADPFMMLIAPCNKFMASMEFAVPNLSGTWQHYVNVVTTRKGAKSLTLDNMKLVDQYFNQVGTSDFLMAEIEIGGYSHHWLRSDEPFAAYQYGYGIKTFDSYGHLCGMK